MKQLPGQLKRDKGLARTGSQSQQDTLATFSNRHQGFIDGIMLIIPRLPLTALILKWHLTKTATPLVFTLVFFAEGLAPQLIRCRVTGDVVFYARVHVDLINAHAISGVGKARLQLLGIALGLSNSLCILKSTSLGFNHRKLLALIKQNVIGDILLRTLACPL